jgi:endogenous inhibitor of DNA gyrase (YacG/DUF329 family)
MSSKSTNREGTSRVIHLTMKCPTCGKPTIYSEANPERPFCSRTCQTGDLAAWASDDYKIPTNETPNSQDDDNSEFDSND